MTTKVCFGGGTGEGATDCGTYKYSLIMAEEALFDLMHMEAVSYVFQGGEKISEVSVLSFTDRRVLNFNIAEAI